VIGHAALLGLLLVGMDGPRAAPTETAADRITLRDGSIVLGLVTSVAEDPRGSIEFVVRRAWALQSCPERIRGWDRSTAPATGVAISQRRQRLGAWRRERAPTAGPDDRIVRWIDHELALSAAPGGPDRSILIKVRLPGTEVHRLERRPAREERLLRLAWLCELPDPERMPLDELKDALEARGYAVDSIGKTPPAALDRLLPPTAEPEPTWLARRAATELAVDPDLRFIRFQDTVMPDTGAAGSLTAIALSTAVAEIQRLLDLDQGPRADPLSEKLKAIESRGRIGAAVTGLEIAPDLAAVTVESTLWIHAGERWIPFVSRNGTVRPEDVRGEAGKNLAADPQVQSVVRIIESLGLGAIPPEVKDRSLRMGAATEKALGLARSAFNQDLEALALPVLEPLRNDRGPDAKGEQRVPR
jgi:hypothetical protein